MHIYCFDGDILEVSIEDISPGDERFYWLDMSPGELEAVNQKIFYFDGISIEECKNADQLAKVDFYDEYTFLVLNSLKYENGVVNPDEFNIFLTKKYVVTVSKKEVKIINDIRQEIRENKSSVIFSKDKSAAKLVYYILDKLIQSDYEIISKLENVADSLEIHILKNPDKQFINGLIHLRHQIHTLRRCIAPLRYIGDNLIANENGIINKEYIKIFNQINSKIDKLIFSLEGLLQYIILVREAFEAEIANKTNELVKLFTILAMFFSPLTLITGIYGMNFKIPECSWRYGYGYSLVLMIFASIVLFFYFKKKNWL